MWKRRKCNGGKCGSGSVGTGVGLENWSQASMAPMCSTVAPLSDSANCTVLRAVVLTQYRRVTDGRTDGQTDRRTEMP